jgi:uncharacterized membrane protein
MTSRRIATLASLIGIEFLVVGLRQLGVIRRVPDLPVRGFDSNAVITSPAAHPFGVPDAPVAAALSATIAALAARRRPGPITEVALAGAVLAGAGGALYYLREMFFRQKRLCIYCLVAASGLLALVPMTASALRRSAPG